MKKEMQFQNQTGTKLEFLLTLGGNIIIQRFFFVNNFNPLSKFSIELYNCVNDICDDIMYDLKQKSFNYSHENQYYYSENDDVETSEQNFNDNFLLEIKMENDIFIQKIFPANVYHPKARYSVDIRPRIKDILNYLTHVLSMNKLQTSLTMSGKKYNLAIK